MIYNQVVYYQINSTFFFQFQIDIHYRRIDFISCRNPYRTFDNLESAKESCSGDIKCKGFIDVYCQGKMFRLCPKNEPYEFSFTDCVYDKEITL